MRRAMLSLFLAILVFGLVPGSAAPALAGGGITFGKSETKDGIGKFSPVGKLENVLGSYGATEAEAGAVKSVAAQALTKGNVSLALTGTGEGWNLGVSGAKFTIARK